MRNEKNHRQSRILQIVKNQTVGTQAELVQALRELGLEVTQATVSRDIKELGIIKVATASGDQIYVPMHQSGEGASGRFMKVFREAVTSIHTSDSLVIVKTLPGMAQAAASALDSMHLDNLIGSIAGDDNVFIATPSAKDAESMRDHLITLSHIAPDLNESF
ncbi:MAG: arginine repressor [Eubacteriales bacterium]|nr:arginine repressor [Eubacteriales bacterium]